ncbi:hypothetical protein BD626DRAFT_109569 [Schizophyllum amplum]|uniref:Uncharacterized protein n=1 Tax=Schizophyllum amplum TaxID=97359 RepID=A0A550CT83_9AGAR|nr:hypothetical protein BD626DRAFT_109569 [Auriculariopsis ampla]
MSCGACAGKQAFLFFRGHTYTTLLAVRCALQLIPSQLATTRSAAPSTLPGARLPVCTRYAGTPRSEFYICGPTLSTEPAHIAAASQLQPRPSSSLTSPHVTACGQHPPGPSRHLHLSQILSLCPGPSSVGSPLARAEPLRVESSDELMI